MSSILEMGARMILDSRGNPTVEVDCVLDSGAAGRAAVPSGASTGKAEALELRDGGDMWMGKGVEDAIENIEGEIRDALLGLDAVEQRDVDELLCEIDGTDNKERLGANAILGVSMAVCRAAADHCELPLYRYLGGPTCHRLPIPLLNVVNGGAHASNSIVFQEFMVAPVGAPDFETGLRWGVEVYHHLKKHLSELGHSTNVGDEGGFAPNLDSDEQVLEILTEAIGRAGYRVGHDDDFAFALDVAASEFMEGDKYNCGAAGMMSSTELVDHYVRLCDRFPITSIEDGLGEEDWEGWQELTTKLGRTTRLVGDDLYATQIERLDRGIDERAGNAILIKLNQVGTVTETLETIERAREAGFRVVVSHRSGETEDHFIADLAVGTGAGWIKTGAPCRTDRNAKYNQLLRVSSIIGPRAEYGGSL